MKHQRLNSLKFLFAIRYMLFAVLVAFFADSAFAQLTISASVSKKSVELDDSLTLSVTIAGSESNVPDPQLPSMPNFNIYSSGRSQNISILNGRISSSITHNFLLTPRSVGKAVIGPVSIGYKGKRYQTSPIEITVLRPSKSQPPQPRRVVQRPGPGSAARQGRPQQRPAVFVTAEVNKKEAYVNEQVNLTVRFYTAVSLLGNPEYVSPSAKGFLSEDLPPMRHGETVINGTDHYYYTEIKTALFGAQGGQARIGPAIVRCSLRKNVGIDPFAPDFFQKFFSQGMGLGRKTKELRTKPITIHIKPLPETGKPASFTGAVGRFRIYTSVDRKRLKAGEAVNLSITIEGTGNLKTITAPALPDMPAFRVYDMASSLNLEKTNDIVHGSKIYKTVIIPKVSGRQTIPALKFSFFNPVSGRYQEVASLPIVITALQPDAAAPQVSFSPQGTTGAITPIMEDIHYIKERPWKAFPSGIFFRISSLGWIHSAPFAIFFGSLVMAGLRRVRERNPTAFRYRKAFAAARSRIKSAQTYFRQGRASEAVSALSLALTDYLSDKLGCPVTGMMFRKILEVIKEKFPRTSAEAISRLERTWQELELLRFAPGESQEQDGSPSPEVEDAGSITVRMNKLLTILERELKK